jgi:hypothetical protein
MHDLTEMQGEIGDDVDAGDDFEHRPDYHRGPIPKEMYVPPRY